jgi:NADPH:quinone reductase-like Zn-dependent oxidoreductase
MTIAKTLERLGRTYELTEFSIQSLSIREHVSPALKGDEVCLKVNAVSLNYRDLLMVRGHYNPKLRFPVTPCSDGAGEIVEVGDAVKNFKVGDRVVANFMPDWIAGRLDERAARSALGGGGIGMLSEYVVLKEAALVAIPSHLSFEEAATLPCAAVTAWNALIATGNLKPGDTVLTLGTGGVSIFAIQIAMLAGADVIATSSSNDKLERLKKMGVKKLVNYKETADWSKVVLDLTGGRGVDHVVEVGGQGTIEKSLKSAALGGHVALIGVLAEPTGDFNPISILMKNIRVQGIYVGSREMFENMNRTFALHQLKPVIDKVFSFTEAPKAFDWLASGQHFGKVVIRISD